MSPGGPSFVDVNWLLRVVSGKQEGAVAAFFRAGLWALTPIYRVAIWGRNRQFDSGAKVPGRVDAKVISIGNITTGGTGKTPMVIHVCNFLQSQNLRPAIVSRGYGAKDSEAPNDEAMELLARLPDVPHVQNPDRVAAAIECVLQHDAEVIVLDDGFQHRRIARDLDVVLIDASNPFGYGYLLPRGLLREPMSSLRRADVVVITRCESVTSKRVDEIKNRISGCTASPIVLARTQPVSLVKKEGDRSDIVQLKSGDWFVFSAIGNPENFEKCLEQADCNVVGSKRFSDHHIFSTSDHARLASEAIESEADYLICTHKDLVKVDPEKLPLPVFALRIGVEVFDGNASLESAITNALR